MVSQKSNKKRRFGLFDYLDLSLNFFLFMFFIIYIGKFGISNFIFATSEGDTWKILFNIGIWYTVVMFPMKEFFEKLKNEK